MQNPLDSCNEETAERHTESTALEKDCNGNAAKLSTEKRTRQLEKKRSLPSAIKLITFTPAQLGTIIMWTLKVALTVTIKAIKSASTVETMSVDCNTHRKRVTSDIIKATQDKL